jgi:hypothetical protein
MVVGRDGERERERERERGREREKTRNDVGEGREKDTPVSRISEPGECARRRSPRTIEPFAVDQSSRTLGWYAKRRGAFVRVADWRSRGWLLDPGRSNASYDTPALGRPTFN